MAPEDWSVPTATNPSGPAATLDGVAAEAKKHTAALAEIFPTSSLKAKGMEPLRTHLAALSKY